MDLFGVIKGHFKLLYKHRFSPFHPFTVSHEQPQVSGAEHCISPSCALSEVTEFLQDGESRGQTIVLQPLPRLCDLSTCVFWKNCGLGINCWETLPLCLYIRCHPHRHVLPGGLLNFFSLFQGGKGVYSLVASSHPSQKLQITLSDLVKLSETVPCVEGWKSRECSAWEHKSFQIKAFGWSCLIAAELSLTRCSPACCSSYHPSLGAKMLILFEICLLSFCPHHPAVRTGLPGWEIIPTPNSSLEFDAVLELH